MIREVITSYDNFSAMIAIMIRIRIKPFPACRRAEGRETAVIHSVYIL